MRPRPPVASACRLLGVVISACKFLQRVALWGAIVAAFGPSSLAAEAGADWPMLAHDAARSGATAVELRPPFVRKWYRLFPDEGIMAGVQPVFAQRRVFLGTLRGKLYAIDAETGRDAWVFQAGGAVLHACAAAEGKVFFGAADGKVYAVSAADGRPAWTVATGAAVWNAPLVSNGLVVIGSRDGSLYAISAAEGAVRWQAPTGGPILSSPALDARAGRVYVGSEDMHVYAFDVATGKRVWQSPKLPGVSLRGYHPVVAPDGAVMVTVQPYASADAIQPVLMDMVKEIFGDMASWRHTKEENERLRAENLKLLEKPDTYRRQMEYLGRRLAEQPACQTFFVLDAATGRPRFVAPIVFAESMNGPGAPPLVLADGRHIVVKYQALLRSRYGHYSPFLNVGYLDAHGGQIAPIMEQSRTYGWHDSLLLVHDEQCQLSAGGRVLINAHQDNVNAMDLDTLVGYGEPWARNIHETKPGEAVGIWAHVLRGEEIPPGKEWLARGTAVYGGGSALDVPVSIAGDSFYYLPTHEINAGAAVIAYRMQPGAETSKAAAPPQATLSDAEWQKVQQMPWDWDTLEFPRLTHVLKALPGPVPGTRQQPLVEEAAAAVGCIADAELDRIIWEAQSPPRDMANVDRARQAELQRAVEELIAERWRPLEFPAGKFPSEAYRFFVEPTETLFTLARAYPLLDAATRGRVREFVAAQSAPGGPLEGPTGVKHLPADEGSNRAPYDVPEGMRLRIENDIVRTELARLYPLWLWAYCTDDWAKLQRDWPKLRNLVRQPPNKMEEDCRNGYLAGLIAYCRIARRLGDDEAVAEGVAQARAAMRERLSYELSHTRGGLIYQVTKIRAIFSRWRHLTPEIARLLAAHAKTTHRHLMDVYVDHHRPTWALAWNVELMMRNECPLSFPTMSAEIFAARAMILDEPAQRLACHLDLPWCKADLFYVQKLTACLEAEAAGRWADVRAK